MCTIYEVCYKYLSFPIFHSTSFNTYENVISDPVINLLWVMDHLQEIKVLNRYNLRTNKCALFWLKIEIAATRAFPKLSKASPQEKGPTFNISDLGLRHDEHLVPWLHTASLQRTAHGYTCSHPLEHIRDTLPQWPIKLTLRGS